MTRKDYIRIARALNSTYTSACETKQCGESLEAILRASYSVASELADDNARFNAQHFMGVVRGDKAPTSRPARSKQCGYCGENPNTAKHRASNCAAKTADLQGLSPEVWAASREPECDCTDRSWYGPGHDSACPARNGKAGA